MLFLAFVIVDMLLVLVSRVVVLFGELMLVCVFRWIILLYGFFCYVVDLLNCDMFVYLLLDRVDCCDCLDSVV